MAVVDRQFMTDGTGQAIAEGLNSVAEAISGGGGGSGDAPFIVEFEIDSEQTVTANKTYEEIVAALEAGKQIYADVECAPGSDFYSASYVPLSKKQTGPDYSELDFLWNVWGDGEIWFYGISISGAPYRELHCYSIDISGNV